ncbi:MAG: hypothetical protein NVV72_11585 [Asticcacaulis sp.]|nr:hypothetical protein [Asticcacaulis sp.]
MQDMDQTIADLGNEPPLIADGRSGPPDRREVSARWLSGTFLTGVTSSVLMGVALFAALDGREQLATPPEIAELVGLASNGDRATSCQDRKAIAPLRQVAKRQGPPPHGGVHGHQGRRPRRDQHDAVRAGQDGAGGGPHHHQDPIPPFDPLAVFAEDGAAQKATPRPARSTA